jgi:hypothetical protein
MTDSASPEDVAGFDLLDPSELALLAKLVRLGRLEMIDVDADICEASVRDGLPRLLLTVAAWQRRATVAEADLAKAREGVARYVNAQGRHLYETWRDHLIECCDLSATKSGPYDMVKP